MSEELDDDIVSVEPPSQEEDDDIVSVSPPQQEASILSRIMSGAKDATNATLEAIPSVIDSLSDKATSALETAHDSSVGYIKGATGGAVDELGGVGGALTEEAMRAMPGLEKLSRGGINLLSKIPGLESMELPDYNPAEVDEQLKKQGFTVPEESFGQKYRGYQQASEQAQKDAEERSRLMFFLSQIGGGMAAGSLMSPALGFSSGAKAKSIFDIARDSGKAKAALELLGRGGSAYVKGLPMNIAESVFTSENQLSGPESNIPGVLSDVVSDSLFSIPAMLGIEAASNLAPAIKSAAKPLTTNVSKKVNKIIDASPVFSGMKHSFNYYGDELGISPRDYEAVKKGVPGIEGGTAWGNLDLKRATKNVDDILKVKGDLGELVDASLTNENAKKIKIDATDIKSDLIAKIDALKKEMPYFDEDRISNNILNTLTSRDYSNMSPRELKDTLDTVKNNIEKLNRITIPSPEMQDTERTLRAFKKQLDEKLKLEVPDYKTAANRYSSFIQTYLEQPISGRYDPTTKGVFYSKLATGKQDAKEAYEKLIRRTGEISQSSADSRSAWSELMKASEKFHAEELDRLAKGKISSVVGIDPDSFAKNLDKNAIDSAVRRSVTKSQEGTSGGKLSILEGLGLAPTGAGNLNMMMQKMGVVRKVIVKSAQKPIIKGPADFARKIYNAPAQSLTNIASKLEANGPFKSLGRSLRESVESGNAYKKNAALFTIMQNPNARVLIDDNDLEDNEYVTDRTR